MTGKTKLGRKGETAIAALLTSTSIAQAAQIAGLSEATLQRWLRNPTFARAFRRARRSIVEAVIGQIQGACGAALTTLVRNLSCASPPTEVRAATALLDLCFRGLTIIDLTERVESLEAYRVECDTQQN